MKSSSTTPQEGTSEILDGPRLETGEIARLRTLIAAELPAVIAALVGKAKDGDVAAARLLLDRAIPALSPALQGRPVPDGAELAGNVAFRTPRGREPTMDEDMARLLDGLPWGRRWRG